MSNSERRLFLVPISVAGWLDGTATGAYAANAMRSVGQALAGLFVIFTLPILMFLGRGFDASGLSDLSVATVNE